LGERGARRTKGFQRSPRLSVTPSKEARKSSQGNFNLNERCKENRKKKKGKREITTYLRDRLLRRKGRRTEGTERGTGALEEGDEILKKGNSPEIKKRSDL